MKKVANTSNKKQTQSAKSGGKGSTAKKTAPEKKKEKAGDEMLITAKRQKAAIILGALGVFLLFVDFIKGESAWLGIHNSLFGLFGFCAFLIPFILFYVAFIFSKDKPLGSISANLTSTGILTVLLCGFIHIVTNTADYFAVSIGDQITDAWDKGSVSPGSGGVIGALFGGVVGKYFGKAGAVVTFVILIIVAFMFLSGTTLRTLASVIRTPVKKMGDMTSERMEKNSERRAAEREEREREEREREKKPFSPPQKPTDSVSESVKPVTVPVSESASPAIPPVKIAVNEGGASADGDDEIGEIVGEILDEKQKKSAPRKRKKAPEPPDGDPSEPKDIYSDSSLEPEEENKQAYVFPPLDCLYESENSVSGDFETEIELGRRKLISTLESFKINAEIINICRGPSVTRYELVPEAGVRISKITSLSDDIALRLAAKSIRIEAPIPGKAAIGIEVPNSAKSMVSMREIIDTPQFKEAKSKLNVALGKDITGNIICADLTKMPHLLVAGTTGSGKSVCLNSMIISILYNATPEEVKLLMIDPKAVEFTVYNGIAHLEVPVVSQPRKAAGALSWAVGEMERRYQLFAENSVRDIKGFNKLAEMREDIAKMHHIVIFIDELADLMMTSPKEVEDSICRLAQKARAAGIHLVIATQRPSVDVITGLIKANIPSRIALFVSSQVDSRTILDSSGAEKLLGNGDMLFAPVGVSKPTRIQGCFISDEEVQNVVNHIKSQSETTYNEETIKDIEARTAASENSGKKDEEDEDAEEWDPVLDEAAEVVITAGGASTTMLQKKLKLGYARASRVMDQLEEKGIVGPSNGAKPRDVLISKQQWYEMQALADGASASASASEAAPDIDSVFADDDDFAGSDDDNYDF